MGEASRRAKFDPTFGRIPKSLKEDRRGIVLTSPWQDHADGSLSTRPLDAQELRHALLFWDELAWPRASVLTIGGGNDADYLIQAGILFRPVVHVEVLSNGIASMLHRAAFEVLDAQAPGKWSLAMGEDSARRANIPEGSAANIALELYRAIPVPKEDVPLAEILEFKVRRQDEITRLRAEIDHLAAQVAQAADASAAVQAGKAYVEEACRDLLRVGMEWQFPVRISNLKCNIEVTGAQAVTAAVAGASITDWAFGLPALGSLIGGAASVIKVKADVNRQPVHPRSSPYQYVYSYHSEVF